jgi:membrane dipeptidase (peptidase family M19)
VTTRVPIFDGHNDGLLRLYRNAGGPQAFLDGEAKGHLDLPKALEGGFAGGLFAVFVPTTGKAGSSTGDTSPSRSDAPTAPAVELGAAQSVVFSMVSLLFRIERESQGRVRICRNVSDIRRCMRDGVLAPVLHIEGAEAIDPNYRDSGGIVCRGASFSRSGLESSECVWAWRAIPLSVFARHRTGSDGPRQGANPAVQPVTDSDRPVAYQ